MSQDPANIQSSLTSQTPATEDSVRPSDTTSLRRFFMTSDLRAATGLTRTHLDFYLREAIIVPTARTESGYLLFDDIELARLRQVIDWRQSGVSIRAIRSRLGRLPDQDQAEVSDD
ncbi:MAG: MerR family transcriptional regulator [Thermomicrobiales bacterium]